MLTSANFNCHEVLG